MQVSGKHVVVVGLGASGIAAARLALRHGARVTGVDAKAEPGAAARALEKDGARLSLGANDSPALREADLVVVSPGVPPFAALGEVRAPVWSEIELAWRLREDRSPVVAVGGTNGKSTTTTLVGELLRAAGKRVFVGGNLGDPWAAHCDEPVDVAVLEVSSFQMERVDALRPRVAVLLNVTDDHLDRYASFDDYARAKGNVFVRQTGEDVAVVPHGDALCLREARRGRARVVTFGPGGDVEVAPAALRLRGGHNALNAAAAVAAARELGAGADVTARVLASFEGLPHRMALVAEIAGVRYYDDSKGTNVGASVTALETLAEPKAVLVAGGRDKGGSYAPLVAALRKKGRALVLLGEAADRIEAAASGAVPVARARSMDEAVALAAGLARAGDAVLLSPACSSFDMFADYKDRGDAFVRAVRRMQP